MITIFTNISLSATEHVKSWFHVHNMCKQRQGYFELSIRKEHINAFVKCPLV